MMWVRVPPLALVLTTNSRRFNSLVGTMNDCPYDQCDVCRWRAHEWHSPGCGCVPCYSSRIETQKKQQEYIEKKQQEYIESLERKIRELEKK